MGVFQNNLMGAAAAAASAGGGDFYSQQIANSIRADTNNGYLHRTPSGAGNRATWTFSTWIKLSQMGTGTRIIYSAGSSGDQDGFYRLYYYANKLIVSSANANFVTPSDTFRDPSAWYNVVWKQGSNATTLYVNGSQIATASVSGNTAVNNNTLQCIGTSSFGGSPTNSEHLDGYFAETIMIDGTALDADSFGETKNGVWIPKDASGLTFGTNGFHLKYESSSDLGNDSSGNNNDWTAVNLATHDQMTDTPTFNSDSNGGNFATMNPLISGGHPVLAEGNLMVDSFSGSDISGTLATFALPPSSGKWYFECFINAPNSGDNYPFIGLTAVIYSQSATMGVSQRDLSINLGTGGSEKNETYVGTITTDFTGVSNYADNTICGVFVDMDNRKLWYAKDGAFTNSGNPQDGTNPNYTWTNNVPLIPHFVSFSSYGADSVLNFGQDGTFAGNVTAGGNADVTGYGNFKYDPGDYKALCSGNLPLAEEIDPAETDDDYPQKLFGAKLYTGDSSTQAITGLGFQPDWVWIKERSNASTYGSYDSTRGNTNVLGMANTTAAEYSQSADPGLESFDSDGFTVDYPNTGDYYVNRSSQTYVAWNWRANGGTTSSNATGDITSTVQADPSGGFSIFTYTGSGTSGDTVAHGLSQAPTMTIIKQRNSTNGWNVWATGYNSGDYDSFGELNSNAAWNANQGANGPFTAAPGATLLTLTAYGQVNGSSNTYVGYAFSDIEGYIKSGAYTGNGNTDGVFVYTGFRPALLTTKRTDGTGHWLVHDNARDTYNPSKEILLWSGSDAEFNSANDNIDFLANGFKIRSSNTGTNGSGNDYIYIAMADNPFKYATAK